MNVLLIMPDAHMHKLRIGSFVKSMREAPLTLTTLAALIPKEENICWKLVDESIDTIPWDFPADLVGISVLTGCATRAYKLAQHFKGQGIPVVLGGVHVSIMPEEAQKYADAVVVGDAEEAWPRLIQDFKQGQLKKVYRSKLLSSNELKGLPIPRRDLQCCSGYMLPNTVQATRGCKRVCDFCTIPLESDFTLDRLINVL